MFSGLGKLLSERQKAAGEKKAKKRALDVNMQSSSDRRGKKKRELLLLHSSHSLATFKVTPVIVPCFHPKCQEMLSFSIVYIKIRVVGEN